jgi:hypothetical protein
VHSIGITTVGDDHVIRLKEDEQLPLLSADGSIYRICAEAGASVLAGNVRRR